MRKLLIIITMYYILAVPANSQLWKQRRSELSLAIGTTQFFGDIGGYSNEKNILGIKDFSLSNTGFNINPGFRNRITEEIALKTGLSIGVFHSSDAGGTYYTRGFEETTLFFEPSVTIQYYFIKNRRENSLLFLQGQEKFFQTFLSSFDFYVFTGLGGLIYKVNPNTNLSDNTTSTSGFTPVVPLGLGFNFLYSSRINFGAEYGVRFTFSDNIDGYTSVHSKSNDIYHMVNFIISYKIARKH